jgi:hypothetical protein
LRCRPRAPGMEIDTAVEFVRLVVAPPLVASVVAGRLRRLKLPRCDREQSLDPVLPGDRLRPVTIEDMRRIPALQMTRLAGRLSATCSSLVRPGLLSGVHYDAVGGSSQCVFLSWGLGIWRFRGARKNPGHSTIRGHGVAPRPQGSHTNPGAAFVTDSVSDSPLSVRSTPAARSPGWLLGSSHSRTRRSQTRSGRSGRRGSPRPAGLQDRPAADQKLPRQRDDGLLL